MNNENTNKSDTSNTSDFISKSSDISEYAEQNRMANKILDTHKGVPVSLYKSTRAGATVSLLVNAVLRNMKCIVIEPTPKIFEHTIEGDVKKILAGQGRKVEIGKIKANKDMCLKIKRQFAANPNFKQIPYYPKCVTCELEDCNTRKLLNKEYDIICLTYHKVKTLSDYPDIDNRKILDKLRDFDVIILDEFTSGVFIDSGKTTLSDIRDVRIKLEELKTNQKYKEVVKFFSEFINYILKLDIEETISKNPNPFVIESEFKRTVNVTSKDVWDFILDLYANDRQLAEKLTEIKILSDYWHFLIKCYDKNILIEALDKNYTNNLRWFINYIFNENKYLIVTDSWMPECIDLKRLFGRNGKVLYWGDPLNTESKQLIICDTKKIIPKDFFLNKDLRNGIKRFLQHKYFSKNQSLIVTLNKKMSEGGRDFSDFIESWKKRGEIDKRHKLTWFRSKIERGINPGKEYRDMVCIGLPILPWHSHVAAAYVLGYEDLIVDSIGEPIKKLIVAKTNIMKHNSEKSSFVNMRGRVKDSLGKEPSVVFCIGSREYDWDGIRWIVKQNHPNYENWQNNSPQPVVVSTLAAGEFYEVAPIMADMWKLQFKFEEPEKDMPILARIINETSKNSNTSPSTIVRNLKNEEGKNRILADNVRATAKKYESVLKHYGIELRRGRGGLSFIKTL